jgi:hypothetical protein
MSYFDFIIRVLKIIKKSEIFTGRYRVVFCLLIFKMGLPVIYPSSGKSSC